MTLNVRNDAVRSVHPPTVGMIVQFVLLALVAGTVGLGPAGWLAGSGYAVASWLLLTRAWHRSAPAADQPTADQPTTDQAARRDWGPANTVTMARGTLVGGVTALVADSLWGSAPVAVLVGLAAVALLLDAVDGQVARRTGTASPLGARYDMETDAVLVLVLSVFLAAALGWWVLLLGLPRYAFGLATRAWPWLLAATPPSRSRKVVAATQGAVLVVLATGLVPAPVATATLVLVLALLGWSFGRDISWLRRVRRLPAGPPPAPGTSSVARLQPAIHVARVGRVRQRA